MFATEPNYSSTFTRKNVRDNFMKKVFSIVGCQLMTSFLVVLILRSSYTLTALSVSLFYPMSLIAAICMFTISCFRDVARKVPTNYFLLIGFTLAESFSMNVILLQYSNDLIFKALLYTAISVGLLGLMALKSKTEFLTSRYTLYFMLGHLGLSLLSLFFYQSFSLLFSWVTTIAFGIYLVIDIQMLMGNKKMQISVDDYIFASMNIYIDISNIFLKLLEILGDSSEKKERKKK